VLDTHERQRVSLLNGEDGFDAVSVRSGRCRGGCLPQVVDEISGPVRSFRSFRGQNYPGGTGRRRWGGSGSSRGSRRITWWRWIWTRLSATFVYAGLDLEETNMFSGSAAARSPGGSSPVGTAPFSYNTTAGQERR
jgi:hypothetical protein